MTKKITHFLTFLRSLFIVLISVLFTAIYSTISIISVWFSQKPIIGNTILKQWSFLMLYFAFIKAKVHGRENVVKEGALYIFNHSSYYDIPLVYKALHHITLRFGSKIELFSVPLFGRAMRGFGVLPITRSDREKVLKLYDEALGRLKKGYNFILAPEGTRSDGKALTRFKSGPFIMAINGQIPLVPIVFIGATDVMPKGSFLPAVGRWFFPVDIYVLPPVPTEGLTLDDRQDLQQKVYEIMSQFYDQKLKEFRERES